MIHQHFIPISPALNKIQQLCNPENDSYFYSQYSLDSSVVTNTIIQSEYLLMNTLEKLSELIKDDDVSEYILALSSERRFLLYTAVEISFLHFHADTQQLPVIPPNNFYLLLGGYLQEGYLSFKNYCSKHNIDMWNEILTYQVSIL